MVISCIYKTIGYGPFFGAFCLGVFLWILSGGMLWITLMDITDQFDAIWKPVLVVVVLWFVLQGTPLDQLDRKHFPKGYQAPTSMKSEKEMAQQVSLSKEIAFAEVKMQKLCELLLEVFVLVCLYLLEFH